LSERGYVSLVVAHQQLNGPIVLARDNVNTRIGVTRCQMIDLCDWLQLDRPGHCRVLRGLGTAGQVASDHCGKCQIEDRTHPIA